MKEPKPLNARTIALQILEHEASAISSLCNTLDESFEQAVALLLSMESNGRLVVSGMGKAGIIAQKVSATFASTGLPSFFLHPAEAIHGDLGRFTKEDVALILSNSGDTEEIVKMLPFLKRMGCSTIAFTGNLNSTLAQHSDVVLHLGNLKEADPLGLAPTTSTTVMLALGDALAMATHSGQDFTKEQFARFHPGGTLGRSLLTVDELMRSGDQQCVVTADMRCREVLQQITSTKGRPGAASVVDKNGKLIGIFTDGDLRRCLTNEPDFLEQPIQDFMGKSPKTVGPLQLVQEALKVMSDHRIDQVIVVNDNHEPVGLLDVQELLLVRSR